MMRCLLQLFLAQSCSIILHSCLFKGSCGHHIMHPNNIFLFTNAASKVARSADVDMINSDAVQKRKNDQNTQLPPM